MKEQELFDLGFKKRITEDFDNEGVFYTDYVLKNVMSDIPDLWNEIVVFKDDEEINDGEWTLCMFGGHYRPADIKNLKWLIDNFKEIDNRITVIR